MSARGRVLRSATPIALLGTQALCFLIAFIFDDLLHRDWERTVASVLIAVLFGLASIEQFLRARDTDRFSRAIHALPPMAAVIGPRVPEGWTAVHCEECQQVGYVPPEVAELMGDMTIVLCRDCQDDTQ